MPGFFSQKEITPIHKQITSCLSCGLLDKCKSPKMEPYGEFKRQIMVIGEAPGDVEDSVGKPWQGKTGKLLQATLSSLGYDLFYDCISINAARCRPSDGKGGNRAPTDNELQACRRFVIQDIQRYKPKVIILLGNAALQSVIGVNFPKEIGSIHKWRGWQIPDQDFKAWICPTFHPSYVDREDSTEVTTVWKSDLREALDKYKEKFPVIAEPRIEELFDLSPLDTIENCTIAFDYETTGLKPHAAGHRIVSASVATGPDFAYAFLMPDTRSKLAPFLRLLARDNVQKMAHNMKFEQMWSVVRLRQSVINWRWDSLLAAHILDNRTGVAGLKFQTYVNFGIADYASDVAPYITSTDGKDGANSKNRIESLLRVPGGKQSLLRYNALDSIYEYMLAMRQQEIMNYDDLPF